LLEREGFATVGIAFWKSIVVVSMLIWLGTPQATAHAVTPQEPVVQQLSLEEAVDLALKHYPAVRAAIERQAAAEGGIGLAKTNYLPRLNMLWQVNRATDNNIPGMLLPNTVIPSISGTVRPNVSNQSVWGSAGGLLFSWVPFDFGYRNAAVESARAAEHRSWWEANVTRLDVAFSAANAFLTLLAAEQTVRTAQADLQRRQVFADSVHVLVKQELRPGVDQSRADAEVAAAKIRVARAEQQRETSRAVLAQVLGMAGTRIEVNPGPLLSAPPEENAPETLISSNPLAEAQRARIIEQQAQIHVLDRTYDPTFYLQSSVFGRGSGVNPDGTLTTGTSGLGPDRSNWAVGVSVQFSLSDLLIQQAQKRIALAQERTQRALYEQTIQDLTGRLAEAQASLIGTRRVAAETPFEVDSAQMTELQARTRYQAGLATVVEVAEAQSLLVRAETDDALARLAVWQNLAGVAATQGDLGPFFQLLRTSGGH
jgi:outer membrane protein